MIKFITQGFTRGMFRNLDARPAELRIAKFKGPPREARHMCGPDFQDYSHYVDDHEAAKEMHRAAQSRLPYAPERGHQQ